VFPARYELNSYIVFRKRLVSKKVKHTMLLYLAMYTYLMGTTCELFIKRVSGSLTLQFGLCTVESFLQQTIFRNRKERVRNSSLSALCVAVVH
jgi:hypothetical protein